MGSTKLQMMTKSNNYRQLANWREKHYTTSLELTMKGMGVCMLFECYIEACSSTTRAVTTVVANRQKPFVS